MRLSHAAMTAIVCAYATARAGDFGPAAIMADRLSGVLAGATIDGKGDALVAWQEPGSTTDRQKARFRPAGGTWSAPTVIGPPPAKLGSFPLLRFYADGRAVAVTTDGTAVWAADMAPGGIWDRPRRLLASNAGPILVTDAAGDTAVVAGLAVTRRAADATTWSAAEAVPTPPTGTYQQIDRAALGPGGDLLIPILSFDMACSRQGCEYDVALYAARETSAGGGWAMSPALWGPTSSIAWQYDSATLVDGRHHAAIMFENGPTVQARIDTPSGWSSAATVFNDPDAKSGVLEGVTVDTTGNAAIAMLDVSDLDFYAVVDGSIVTNSWGAPVTVSASDHSASAIGAFGSNATGGVVLSWADSLGTIRVASRVAHGDSWRKVQAVHSGNCGSGFPDCVTAESAAINDSGQQLVAWQFLHGQNSQRTLKAAVTK